MTGQPSDGTDRSRRRYYPVSPMALVLNFIDGYEYRVTDGFPDDVEFITAGFNEERGEFGIVIRHNSFDPVEDGERLPEGEIEIEAVYDDVEREAWDYPCGHTVRSPRQFTPSEWCPVCQDARGPEPTDRTQDADTDRSADQ